VAGRWERVFYRDRKGWNIQRHSHVGGAAAYYDSKAGQRKNAEALEMLVHAMSAFWYVFPVEHYIV